MGVDKELNACNNLRVSERVNRYTLYTPLMLGANLSKENEDEIERVYQGPDLDIRVPRSILRY